MANNSRLDWATIYIESKTFPFVAENFNLHSVKKSRFSYSQKNMARQKTLSNLGFFLFTLAKIIALKIIFP